MLQIQRSVYYSIYFLLFGGLLLSGKWLGAQSQPKPFLLSWTELDGLSDNHINALLKDRHGLIWVATANGLGYFDGSTFQNFKPDPSDSLALHGSEVVSLMESKNGALWIGTDGGGLSIFSYDTQQFRSLKQNLINSQIGLKENRVYAIWEDTLQKEIFIGYRAIGSGTGGISIFDQEGNITAHKLEEVNDYAHFSMKVTHILQDQYQPDIFWLAGRSFFKWNRKTGALKEFAHPKFYPNYNSVSSIVQANDSILLLASYYFGIQQFNTKSHSWGPNPHSVPVNCIKKGQNDHYWLADNNGLGYLQGLEDTTVHYILTTKGEQSPFPPGTYIIDLILSGNDLWIATNQGLFFWHPSFQQFQTKAIFSPKGIALEMPRLVHTLHANEWILMDRSGNLIFTDSCLHVKRLLPNPKPGTSHAFTNYSNNQIFLAGANGLFHWNPKKANIEVVKSPPQSALQLEDLQIWSIYADTLRHKLWLGTRYNGLIRIQWPKGSIRQFLHQPGDTLSLCHNQYLFEIDEGPDGNLWICTDKGLSVIHPEEEKFKYYPNLHKPLNGFVIHCLEKDDNQGMWIGSRNQGLFRFDLQQQRLEKFSIPDGLPYNGVNRILRNDQSLWLTTRAGLCQMNLENFRIRTFTKMNGLAFKSLYASELQQLPGNDLMLNYQYSPYFTRFQPEKLKEEIALPHIVIQSLRRLGKKENQTTYLLDRNHIQLAAEDNYFAIDFLGIQIQNNQALSYEYKLEGYNDSWIPAGKNKTAIYTQLPGGNYQFKVRAIVDNTTKSDYATLAIYLDTPWYKKSWFLACCILGIILLIGQAYNLRIQQLKKETEFKQLLAETEIIALRAQINPHFIFNCLNSIKSYIIENEIKAGTQYVSRFARLIRMILIHCSEKQVELSTELEIIELYLWLEQGRLQHFFNYEINLQNIENPNTIKIPPMLVQPFVENAIWHGIMNRAKNGSIHININKNGHSLIVQIKDNGVGFAHTRRLKEQSNVKRTSKGIELIERRIAQINTLYEMNAQLDIKNAYENAQYPGTLVTLSLPLLNLR